MQCAGKEDRMDVILEHKLGFDKIRDIIAARISEIILFIYNAPVILHKG